MKAGLFYTVLAGLIVAGGAMAPARQGCAGLGAAFGGAVEHHALGAPRDDFLGVARHVAAGPARALLVDLLVGVERLRLGAAGIEALAHHDGGVHGHGAGAQRLERAAGQRPLEDLAATGHTAARERGALGAGQQAIGDAGARRCLVSGHRLSRAPR